MTVNHNVHDGADQDGEVAEKGNLPSTAADLGEEARVIESEIEKQVLRKIDWFLMPAMVIGELDTDLLMSHNAVDLTLRRRIWTRILRQGQ